MKRILVPCDFFPPSLQAIKFAASIAEDSGGELSLLHTVELPSIHNSSFARGFESDYMKGIREGALDKLGKVKDKYAGHSIHADLEVGFGKFFPLLTGAIKKSKIDLLIMGTQGATGLKEFSIGSNAEKVVRNSPVPVICVRKAPTRIKNIVFPVVPDMKQELLVMKVKALQSFFDSTLHVVYINTPNLFKKDSVTEPLLEKLATRFALKNCTLSIYNDESPEAGIINFTGKVSGDLVAMGTHGRKGIYHLAAGSVAEDIVNHVECPVWTMKIT